MTINFQPEPHSQHTLNSMTERYSFAIKHCTIKACRTTRGNDFLLHNDRSTYTNIYTLRTFTHTHTLCTPWLQNFVTVAIGWGISHSNFTKIHYIQKIHVSVTSSHVTIVSTSLATFGYQTSALALYNSWKLIPPTTL
jgi:hypothetical protein